MLEVDILYNVMQCTDLTVQRVEKHLNNFQAAVTRIRNSGITDHSKISLSSSAKEVCDNVSFNVSETFKFSGHLRIAQLFLVDKFSFCLSCFATDRIQAVHFFIL